MESGQSKFSKPNFLIVGAAKAGTTSLAKYLNKHPDIFIPEKKELRFFVRDTILKTSLEDPLLKGILESSILDEQEYFSEFKVDEKLCGEASVHYLYHFDEAIPKIKKYLGDIPIIIMLRNPVNRAISNYEYLNSYHFNSFEKEIFLEKERIHKNYNSFWNYTKLGLYNDQVKAYKDNFSNVKIILFEEFVKNTGLIMNDVFEFLGVVKINSNYEIYNQSVVLSPIRRFLGKFGIPQIIIRMIGPKIKKQVQKSFGFLIYRKSRKKYSKKTIDDLYTFFQNDIKVLEKTIQMDLSDWKRVN